MIVTPLNAYLVQTLCYILLDSKSFLNQKQDERQITHKLNPLLITCHVSSTRFLHGCFCCYSERVL